MAQTNNTVAAPTVQSQITPTPNVKSAGKAKPIVKTTTRNTSAVPQVPAQIPSQPNFLQMMFGGMGFQQPTNSFTPKLGGIGNGTPLKILKKN